MGPLLLPLAMSAYPPTAAQKRTFQEFGLGPISRHAKKKNCLSPGPAIDALRMIPDRGGNEAEDRRAFGYHPAPPSLSQSGLRGEYQLQDRGLMRVSFTDPISSV